MKGIKLSNLLPLIGLILFVYIIVKTGIDNILQVFSILNPRLFVLMVPLFFIILLLKGLKWKIVLSSLGIRYPLIKCSKIWNIGYATGLLTPGKIGDFIRAFYVKKDTGKNFGECFSTVFIDRIFDLTVILVLAVISIFILSSMFVMKIDTVIILIIILLIFVIIFIIINKKIMKILLRPFFNIMVPSKYKGKLKLSFHSFFNTFSVFWKDKNKIFIVAILTLIIWFLSLLYVYFIVLLLELKVNLLYVLLIVPLITVVEIIPISVSGLGTREAAMIFLFSLIGINQSTAVGFSLAYLILGSWTFALIGFVFWLKNPVNIKL